MCVVEVEGVEGMILSCQEKAVDGAIIKTQSDALFKERQNIMRLYNVNHPLECGVCDKSGECDLQNKTLEFRVDAQHFTARDTSRPVENWGYVSYDPSLCIMCEKCVRVSTEITGDEALKVKFGGYGSEIINVKPDANYASLGEAAAVCPVGALVQTHFKYTSNAWELTKIPASCAHCPGGCQMYYEVKPASISDRETKIYRVTNEYEFSTLCGAGRFGYDFANRGVAKDEAAFKKAVEALRKADTIRFSPFITNEEALLLQRIADKTGAKLVSPEAYAYAKFMRAYASVTGKRLYEGTLEKTEKSDVIIIFGTRLNNDAPMVKYAVNKASKHNRARVVYMHPIEDAEMQNVVTQFIKYEPGTETGVAALLVEALLRDVELPEAVRKTIEGLDVGYLSAESNVGEEELEAVRLSMWKRRRYTLIVGSDLYMHSDAENIARWLALFERYGDFNVVCVPPAGNALGVALICDLDEAAQGYVVGYNAPGDFVLSALGEGDLDMPALNQQEGTFVTVDRRVVPTRPAVEYEGYELNDLASELGAGAEYTIDMTPQLPADKGFKAVAFDDLPDRFEPTGKPVRGYPLDVLACEANGLPEEPDELDTYDGIVVYRCDPVEHFSPFTAKSPLLATEAKLVGSEQFAKAAKLGEGDRVRFEIDGVVFERVFTIDTSMKGTIALNPAFDTGLSSALLSSYRFSRPEMERLNNQPTGSEHE
jgi:NADH-quinone oxidoreductase subunit G